MISPKQKAANRLNAIKSTGPRTQEGIRSASLNAVKHRLSLPVSEHTFGKEIAAVTALVREDEAEAELKAWMYCAPRFELIQLVKAHENKQKAWITFTTSNKKPKGKERVEEMRFLRGFMRLQDTVLIGKITGAKKNHAAAIRYQKRAINQLVKAFNQITNGEEF